MDLWILVSDIVVLLMACLLMGGLFSRLGQSPLVGYLLAGMFLGGPGSLHFVKSEHEIEAIAELGVSLLLFSLGLEFSINRLKKLGGTTLLAGVLQVCLTLLVFAALAWGIGRPWTASLAVGAMITLSSTAVVLRTLAEQKELETPYGGNSLAVLLVQDMAVVPLAIMVTLLAGGNSPMEVASNVGRIIIVSSGLVLGLYVLLNYVAYYALATLTLERNRELTIILSVVTGLGSAWASHQAGISPALGAFVAGMFLGSSPFATQIRADVSPLRVVLLTLFFGAAGMVADPVWIFQHAVAVLVITLCLLVIKMVLVSAIFWGLGKHPVTSLSTGICLAQIGEFAFVLGKLGLENNVISDETNQILISATIVSLFISPFLLANSHRIAQRLVNLIPKYRNLSPDTNDDAEFIPDVLIIGFGPTGKKAAQIAMEQGLRTFVIDLNRKNVHAAKELGCHAHLGDATQLEVLEHARANLAKVVVITMPTLRYVVTASDLIRIYAPQAHIIARSRHQRDTQELVNSGADVVFDDEFEVGERIGLHLCSWIFEFRHAEAGETIAVTKTPENEENS